MLFQCPIRKRLQRSLLYYLLTVQFTSSQQGNYSLSKPHVGKETSLPLLLLKTSIVGFLGHPELASCHILHVVRDRLTYTYQL